MATGVSDHFWSIQDSVRLLDNSERRVYGICRCGIATGIIGGLLGSAAARFLSRCWYLFGFTQHEAQGTSLAVLLPPIGLLAAMRYYQAGHVNFKVAGLLAAGFFVGAYFGAVIATHMDQVLMKRLFGGFLLVVALHMIFGHQTRTNQTAPVPPSVKRR